MCGPASPNTFGGATGAPWKRLLGREGILCFGFAQIANPDRERAEAALIYKHKPPANRQCGDDFLLRPTRVVSIGRAALIVPDFTAS